MVILPSRFWSSREKIAPTTCVAFDAPLAGPPGRGPGTDFLAVEEGYVSVTPLQIDLTRFDAMQGLSDWLEHFS